MLPKRSTPVDQNLGSESTHSQLSVAIFRALRNRLVTQKSLMYFQTCQKHGKPCIPSPRVSKTRDIMPFAKAAEQHSWIYTFWVNFLLIGTFLSLQSRSGGYKNSQRKLRHHSTRLEKFHDDHLIS